MRGGARVGQSDPLALALVMTPLTLTLHWLVIGEDWAVLLLALTLSISGPHSLVINGRMFLKALHLIVKEQGVGHLVTICPVVGPPGLGDLL